MQSLCYDWEFTPQWSDEFARFEGTYERICIPHTVKQLPLHCADSNAYQMICGYRRKLTLPPEAAGKRVFLQFDAAAHIAEVFLNGEKIAEHRCGYTAFRAELTGHLQPGENDVAVRLDTTENASVPPFGFVIDYLTYGGIYRPVWLDIRSRSYISDVFVETPFTDTADVTIKAEDAEGCRAAVRILKESGEAVELASVEPGKSKTVVRCKGVTSWSPDHPVMYVCETRLISPDGAILDEVRTRFGFRTARFKADGFYMNGKKFFLRGLNRHQSYPYMDYAAPESLQRDDARLLKNELQCTAVRTSHYPQSQYFIDECDRLGLLVFTELPGWQHIGDAAWKEQACENLREMILQYRNHPSIILWGVRINESQDDDEFYARTNAIAHELDPGRATSGVRYLEKSHLLEDVYAYNDFSHDGVSPGAKKKKDVTTNPAKAYLISECNGHMFPTKSFDSWEKRQEHALRHARVQDAAVSSGEHAGCFGWCFADYQTHKDFGSGDRICYHGVMDAFRNPKMAASLYASQGESMPVLEISSSMDIGDYPAGKVGKVWAFTNADEVRIYKNGDFVTAAKPGPWKGLKHGPMLMEDFIGELLEKKEGYSAMQASAVRRCLQAAGEYGLPNLPLQYKLELGAIMLKYKMSFEDGVALYGKYVGNWGGESTVWRFDAVKNGAVVSSCTRSPSAKLHLEVKVSRHILCEEDTWDAAAVRVRILDENGCPAPYAQLPVSFRYSGPGRLIGPETATAEGGMTGTYVATDGNQGDGQLEISVPGIDSVTIPFKMKVAH